MYNYKNPSEKTNLKNMEVTYRFYKTPENRWFVDIPKWEGDIDELEMISGADYLCELIAQGDSEFKCTLSDEKMKASYTLIKTKDGKKEIGGAWYVLPSIYSIDYNLDLWLCDVTAKIFERFPDIIYFYRNHF
jgi:hypothetical protein